MYTVSLSERVPSGCVANGFCVLPHEYRANEEHCQFALMAFQIRGKKRADNNIESSGDIQRNHHIYLRA